MVNQNKRCVCKEKYYLTNDQETCKPCIEKCNKCTNNITCDTCELNYFSNDTCFECIRWIQPSDINISLIDNFNQIEISVNSSLNISNISTIRKYITSETLNVIGENSQESKKSNIFTITLGKNNLVFTKNLTLNLSTLAGVGIECFYFKSNETTYKINNQYCLPEPVSIINAPDEVNINCEKITSFTAIGISSKGGYGQPLACAWEAFGNNKKLNIDNQDICILTIDSDKLQNLKELTLNLNVTNYFGKSNLSTKKIRINEKSEISLELNKANSCKPNLKCLFYVDTIAKCKQDDEVYTYVWTLKNSNSSFEDQRSATLIINPFTLLPGNYSFDLRITSNAGLDVKTEVNVTVSPEKPQIFISKTSGTISAKEDLFLDASQSLDMNTNSNETLDFNWTCFNSSKKCPECYTNLNPCLNPDPTNESSFKISNSFLLFSNFITVNLSVCSKNYNICDNVTFKADVSEFPVPSVKIFELSSGTQRKKFSLNSVIALKANVSTSYDIKSEKWYFSEKNKDLLSEYDEVFIEPQVRHLITGERYSLTFEVETEKSIASFNYEFFLNSAPQFGGFTVIPSSGIELNDSFYFSATEWHDDDLPLSYYFAYGNEQDPILLRMSQSSSFNSELAWVGDNITAICRIYDSIGDFVQVFTDLNIEKLSDEDIESIINTNKTIEPPTNIPVSIFNILTSTLGRDNSTENSSVPDNKTLAKYQTVYEYSVSNIQNFINISSPSDFFINQTLNLLLILTINPILNNQNSESNIGLTKQLLKSVDEIGIDKNQAEGFLDVLQKIIDMSDKIVQSEKDSLIDFSETNDKVNFLAVQRIRKNSNLTVSSKNIASVIQKYQRKDFKGLKFNSSDYTFSLPDIFGSNSNEDQNFELAVISSHIKLEPWNNSTHDLISITVYNSSNFSEIQVKTEEKNIIIEVPIQTDYQNISSDQSDCYFFNLTSKTWSKEGCKIEDLNDNSVFCACNHLTTFTIGIFQITTDPFKKLKKHGVETFKNFTFKLPGFLLPIVLFLAYCVAIVRVKFFSKIPNEINTQTSKNIGSEIDCNDNNFSTTRRIEVRNENQVSISRENDSDSSNEDENRLSDSSYEMTSNNQSISNSSDVKEPKNQSSSNSSYVKERNNQSSSNSSYDIVQDKYKDSSISSYEIEQDEKKMQSENQREILKNTENSLKNQPRNHKNDLSVQQDEDISNSERGNEINSLEKKSKIFSNFKGVGSIESQIFNESHRIPENETDNKIPPNGNQPNHSLDIYDDNQNIENKEIQPFSRVILKKILEIIKAYKNNCHILKIIILNSPVPRKYYQITKIFFILYIEILFDALLFSITYTKNTVEDFDKMLENNLDSFNLIAILITASLVFIAKILLYIIEIIPVKKRIKYRFMILPVIFVLAFIYILYKVSCISTQIGEKASNIWILCCFISIGTEIFIFEPLGAAFAHKIQNRIENSRCIQTCYKSSRFWRYFRCENCRICARCKSNFYCSICQNCSQCWDGISNQNNRV